ncbi:MAG: iron-containing alcohol dehydrogenase [Gammaproteobacteria bacterium]|nr:iron-containing alcohol dehydrogenase [Gammaproteobacteria bacterium]
MSNLSGNWNYPTTIRFGAGRITELPQICAELGVQRPLLVTDPGLVKLPLVEGVMENCQSGALQMGIFSDIKPNPVGRNVEQGLLMLRDGAHDGVIAVGGGSAMDAGKAIAFMAPQTQSMWDFEDVGDNWRAAQTDGILPIIAVPTTAGTGSEVGRASVIVNEALNQKIVVFHPRMLPSVVLSDPELTLGLPPHMTAATGMDALAHCLEAYCAPGYHPMADGIAVEGMRLVKDALPRAFADGADIEARAHMLIAASMGATAFQKGLGAIHALSHPVGALYDTHHGLTNAVFMPYVLAFNRPAIEERLQRLARWLALPDPGFAAVLAWVLELREQLSIPHTLAALGVDDQHLTQLAEMAPRDPTAGGNPIPLDEHNSRELLQAALEGRLNT